MEEYVNLIKFSKINSASGGYVHEYLKVNDRIKSLTTPSEKTTEYTYDEFNRIKLKETLFPDGLVEPDVLSTRFNYDKDFLTTIQHKSLDDTVNENYLYDERGNIVEYKREKVDSNNISLEILQRATYQYDNLNRLVREDIGNVAKPDQMINSISKNPNRWKQVKEVKEAATGRKYRGGTSYYRNYINKWTGAKSGSHIIIRNGKILHKLHYHLWIG